MTVEPSLAARYREAVATADAWNPVLETLLAHRSVRAYTAKALPPGTLELLVAAAQSAPSSSNLQTWSVVAVQDQARRQRLAALAGNQKHVAQAPLFLCWLADLSRTARMAGAAPDGLSYLEATLLGVIDAALAAQNASTAAESLGLGTVYIGGLRNQPEAVAAELALPPRAMAMFGMCVGYEDPAARAAIKPRLPQSVVLHHEQYTAEAAAGIARYDTHLAAFQAEQAMRAVGWSRVSVSRLADAAALRGRDRMREAMLALGFPSR